jgi:hypothetical protein
VRAAPHDAVVLADGFSCRTQLEQLGRVQSLHLAQLLDDATPTSPEPSGQLGREWTLTTGHSRPNWPLAKEEGS